jgi:hypothetical protein
MHYLVEAQSAYPITTGCGSGIQGSKPRLLPVVTKRELKVLGKADEPLAEQAKNELPSSNVAQAD